MQYPMLSHVITAKAGKKGRRVSTTTRATGLTKKLQEAIRDDPGRLTNDDLVQMFAEFPRRAVVNNLSSMVGRETIVKDDDGYYTIKPKEASSPISNAA